MQKRVCLAIFFSFVVLTFFLSHFTLLLLILLLPDSPSQQALLPQLF